MSIDIATLMLIVLAFCFLLCILIFILMLRQNRVHEALKILDINQQNIAKFQNGQTQTNQEKNLKFWYEKISLLDEKQVRLSSSIHKQIEKNLELFSNLKTSQEQLEKNLQTTLFERLENVSEKVDKRLEYINEKVENRLKKGFETIDVTFKDILNGISKIHEARRVIQNLSIQVTSLQDILTDKKTRGVFGEIQLNNILKTVYGDRGSFYAIQSKLPNGYIADAIIKAPMGQICIDSKFPLENFRKIHDDKSFQAAFRKDMKNHINTISEKYIIPNQTAQMAVLFLPAEAIFAHINAHELDLIDYARRKNISIASPTTLMALLSTILALIKDIQTRKQAVKIQEELIKLSQNFKLYKLRWENLSKHLENVGKDVKDIGISTDKIVQEFNKIENLELNEQN